MQVAGTGRIGSRMVCGQTGDQISGGYLLLVSHHISRFQSSILVPLLCLGTLQHITRYGGICLSLHVPWLPRGDTENHDRWPTGLCWPLRPLQKLMTMTMLRAVITLTFRLP